MDQRKALARRIYEELWSGGNLAVAEECCAADCVNNLNYLPDSPQVLHGPEALKRLVQANHAAFHDFSTTVLDQIAEGDRVVTRWVTRGIHTEPWMGVAPTRRRIAATGISIDRIADGRIVETWTNWDFWGLMEQLGVVSLPQPGA